MTDHRPRASLDSAYSVRPASLQDLEPSVELWNAISMAVRGEPDVSVEEIRNDWGTPGFSLERSSRAICSADGILVGYSEVWDLEEVPVSPRVYGCVHPDHEGRGLGSYLLAWSEERCQEVLQRTPSEARVVMQVGTFSEHRAARRLMEDHGLRLIRRFWDMVIEFDQRPPAPEWPAGIKARPFSHDRDAEALYRAEEESFRDHWGYIEEPFEAAYKRWSHHVFGTETFDPSLWTLAVHQGEIVGAVRCRPESETDPEMGWISSIFVREPWRRRGLGLAMLQHAFTEFYDRGKARAGLGVDSRNLTGATRLYEKAGMIAKPRYDFYEKELRPGKDLTVR